MAPGEHDATQPFHFITDRKIQTKLLEFDDEFLANELTSYPVTKKTSCNSSSTNRTNNCGTSQVQNKSSKIIASNTPKPHPFQHDIDICRWCPDAKIILRKPEPYIRQKNINSNKENSFVRDTKKSNDSSSFKFRHYSDSRKYIEQYRLHHTFNNNPKSLGRQVCDFDSNNTRTNSPLITGSHNLSFIPRDSLVAESDTKSVPIRSIAHVKDNSKPVSSSPYKPYNRRQSSTPTRRSIVKDECEDSPDNQERQFSFVANERSKSSPLVQGVSIYKQSLSSKISPALRSGTPNKLQNSGLLSETSTSGHFSGHKLGSVTQITRPAESSYLYKQVSDDKQKRLRKEAGAWNSLDEPYTETKNHKKTKVGRNRSFQACPKDTRTRNMETILERNSFENFLGDFNTNCQNFNKSELDLDKSDHDSYSLESPSVYSKDFETENQTNSSREKFKSRNRQNEFKYIGNEEKGSVPHRRRIKHIIEQSKLKSFFGKTLIQSKDIFSLENLSPESYKNFEDSLNTVSSVSQNNLEQKISHILANKHKTIAQKQEILFEIFCSSVNRNFDRVLTNQEKNNHSSVNGDRIFQSRKIFERERHSISRERNRKKTQVYRNKVIRSRSLNI